MIATSKPIKVVRTVDVQPTPPDERKNPFVRPRPDTPPGAPRPPLPARKPSGLQQGHKPEDSRSVTDSAGTQDGQPSRPAWLRKVQAWLKGLKTGAK